VHATAKDHSSDDFTRNRRRRQLIEATIRTIAGHGLSRVTLAKVAHAADLSPGIVNFYFNSKEQLLLETLSEMEKEYEAHIQAAIAKAKDPARVLLRLIDALFDPVIFSSDKAAVWSAYWGESQARSDYLAICGSKDADIYGVIHRSMSRLCEENALAQFDSHAAARGFEGLLDGYWQELLCGVDAFDVYKAKDTCRGYLRNLFPASFEDATSPVGQAPLRTLMAPWTYANEEFCDLEIEHLFKRNWLLAGHIRELRNSGDFITFNGLGERAIVVRGMDNKLRAFHNVCRHRGSRVVRATSGTCKRSVVCPFHGWTYNLDGSLKNVPAEKTFTPLDKRRHGLVPIDLEIWNGFIFISFLGAETSVASRLAPIADKVAPYQLENMAPISPEFRETRPVNWKVVHDIDNEGYHVPVGHPSLHQLFGRDYEDLLEDGLPCSYGTIQDKTAKLWSVANYQKLLPRYDHLPDENQKRWFYFGIFPNLGFGLYPDCIEYYMTLPVSAGKTLYIGRSFALPDERREARAARYLNMRINRQTSFEDESFVDWIQQGMSSSAFPAGTLSSTEWGVSTFHQNIQTILPVGHLEQEPAAGMVAKINDSMSGQPDAET
jgi:phenylpropionate dioxygenase-like ring-hydroxylating dioxygenase large terminal subunit